jgi:hypothetical protein
LTCWQTWYCTVKPKYWPWYNSWESYSDCPMCVCMCLCECVFYWFFVTLYMLSFIRLYHMCRFMTPSPLPKNIEQLYHQQRILSCFFYTCILNLHSPWKSAWVIYASGNWTLFLLKWIALPWHTHWTGWLWVQSAVV